VKLPIEPKLKPGLCLAAALLLVQVGVSYKQAGEYLESSSGLVRSHEVIGELRQLRGNLSEAESGERGFILTLQPTYLGPYLGARTSVVVDAQRLRGVGGRETKLQVLLKTHPALIGIGRAGGSHGEMVIFLRGNGVGFDMRHPEKMVGVFQRLHRAGDFESTGIGLANVHRILRRHGGGV
jgi:hypothetical protein